MIALLKLLIFGHLHKWVTIREVRYEEWETVGRRGAEQGCHQIHLPLRQMRQH